MRSLAAFLKIGTRIRCLSTGFRELLLTAPGVRSVDESARPSGSDIRLDWDTTAAQTSCSYSPSKLARISTKGATRQSPVSYEGTLRIPDRLEWNKRGLQTDNWKMLDVEATEMAMMALEEDGKWTELVGMLTGSPVTPGDFRDVNSCVRWLGKAGKQEACVRLLELLKKKGELEQSLSQYLLEYTFGALERTGAKQGLLSFRAIEEALCLKPSSSHFESLIRHFCSRGQVERGLDVLEEMQSRGLNLRSSSFNPLLESFSDRLMMDEAFETMAAMRRLKIQPSSADYNALIRGCVKAGNMEKAYAVLAELQKHGIKPTAASFHFLMKGFGQQKRVKRALSVLREMSHAGIEPNKDTYRVLLQACAWNQDLNEAMKAISDGRVVADGSSCYYISSQLMNQAKRLGLENDEGVCSAITSVYVACGKLGHGQKLVEEIEGKGADVGAKVKSEVLRGLALAGRLEEAHKLYEDFKLAGKLPTPETVATLLVAYGKVGRMDLMIEIFEQSRCSGSWNNFPVDYRTSYLNSFCMHVSLAFVRHTKLREAEKFLQHISGLGMANDGKLFDKIFLHFASSGIDRQEKHPVDVKDCLSLLRSMRAHGFRPSRIALEALLDCCTFTGNSENALEVIQEMENECLPLNILSKIRLFRVFVAARNEKEAEKVLESISWYDLSDQDVRLLLLKVVQLDCRKIEGSAPCIPTLHRRVQRLLAGWK